ncbi:MAG: hypothetical protein ACKOK8_01055, partial [Planctomycetia bacterium]
AVVKPVVHSVDASTRIWKENGFGTLDDLAAAATAGAVVQVNLTWAPGGRSSFSAPPQKPLAEAVG